MNSQVRIIYTDTQDAHSYMITSKLEVNWSTQPLETWHKNTTWFQESQACEQFDPAKLSLKQQHKRTILNFNSVPTSLQQAAHASSRQGHWNHQAYRSERIQNNDDRHHFQTQPKVRFINCAGVTDTYRIPTTQQCVVYSSEQLHILSICKEQRENYMKARYREHHVTHPEISYWPENSMVNKTYQHAHHPNVSAHPCLINNKKKLHWAWKSLKWAKVCHSNALQSHHRCWHHKQTQFSFIWGTRCKYQVNRRDTCLSTVTFYPNK